MQTFHKNQCRICLNTQNLVDIFSEKASASATVAEKITYCASVQLQREDLLPSKICRKCLFYTNVAYTFRVVCEWTDLKLRQDKPAPSNCSHIPGLFGKMLLSQDYSIHPIEALLRQENLVTFKSFDDTLKVQEQQSKSKSQTTLKEIFIEISSSAVQSEIVGLDNENTVDLLIKKGNPHKDTNLNVKVEKDFVIEEEILLNDDTLLAYEKEHLITDEFLAGNCLVDEDNKETSDDGLIYECAYSPLCSNSCDPLLLTSSTKATLTANEHLETKLEKHIDLANISLDDFENFEKQLSVAEKLPNETTQNTDDKSEHQDNQTLMTKLENRVGRHIAKKNARQPPKRYSPTPQGIKQAAQKDTKPTETEAKSDLLEYILETDLPMPEPIFEETIITDSFYLTDNERLIGNDDEDEPNKLCMQSKMEKKQCAVEQTSNNNYSFRAEITHDYGFENSDDDYDTDYSNDTDPRPTEKYNLSTKIDKNKRKTTCKICNKSFPFPSHLQRHLTAHIGIKRFFCKYCDKQFLHRYNLSVHLLSHTGNFPLRCSTCSRGFASPSCLERHERSHTGETPYQCRYCSQLFTQVSSLRMHEKMHLSRPAFTCDICLRVFSYKSSLTVHKRTHIGLKPHRCNICPKMFTRRASAIRHMLSHSEGKKFKCQTCGKVVGSKNGLVKHRKVHT